LTSVHYPFDTRIFHKECKSLALAGNDVTLIAPHAGGDQEQNGVKLRAIKPPTNRRERLTATILAVYREALRQDADIYHFHDPELMPIGALLKLHGKRVIYDVHEDYSSTMLYKHWIPANLRKLASFAVRASERTLALTYDRVVAATPTIAGKFHPGQTRLVRNFPWLNELRSADSVPYEEREPIAVFVGWLGDERGLRELTRAVSLAAKTLSVKLIVAGKVIPGALAQFANDPGSELVEYAGFLSRPQIAALLSRARVGFITALPTGNAVNALSTKLFEYMSAGVPAIVSDFPVNRQIVADTGCALLVDPRDPSAIADALIWLLSHPTEAAEMGRKGQRAVAERYNWEHEAEILVRTYAELQPA
jgi:glycosyltransferase involved in cell wall biosynthesis